MLSEAMGRHYWMGAVGDVARESHYKARGAASGHVLQRTGRRCFRVWDSWGLHSEAPQE